MVTRTLQNWVSSGAPDGLATPALLVAPALLLIRQRRCIIAIDVGNNRYRNGFVDTTVERYQFSFVKFIFNICQPNHNSSIILLAIKGIKPNLWVLELFQVLFSFTYVEEYFNIPSHTAC